MHIWTETMDLVAMPCAMKYKMSLLQTDPSISADPNSFQIC